MRRSVEQVSVNSRAASSAGLPRGGRCACSASRSVERAIIGGLERATPVVAEDIKKRLFVFDDSGKLDDASIVVLV